MMFYERSNEDLQGIVEGMNINETDDVLAVCGSGDQAFAMLEKAHSVKAIDLNPAQAEYAIKRKEALQKGDYEGFATYHIPDMYDGSAAYKHPYFQDIERLKIIREKLGSLEIAAEDMKQAQGIGRFSKAYLSNIIGYDSKDKGILAYRREGRIFLRNLAESMRAPGLIYITNGSRAESRALLAGKLPRGIEIDRELTIKARVSANKCIPDPLITWKPIVLRKTEEAI